MTTLAARKQPLKYLPFSYRNFLDWIIFLNKINFAEQVSLFTKTNKVMFSNNKPHLPSLSNIYGNN